MSLTALKDLASRADWPIVTGETILSDFIFIKDAAPLLALLPAGASIVEGFEPDSTKSDGCSKVEFDAA